MAASGRLGCMATDAIGTTPPDITPWHILPTATDVRAPDPRARPAPMCCMPGGAAKEDEPVRMMGPGPRGEEAVGGSGCSATGASCRQTRTSVEITQCYNHEVRVKACHCAHRSKPMADPWWIMLPISWRAAQALRMYACCFIFTQWA